MTCKRSKNRHLREGRAPCLRPAVLAALWVFLYVIGPLDSALFSVCSAAEAPNRDPVQDGGEDAPAGTEVVEGDAGVPADEDGEPPERPDSLTTLSILPFGVGTEGEEKEIGERMAEELQVPLSESGRFRILTRTAMTLEKMNSLIELQAKQGKAEERAPFQRLTCEEAFVCGKVRREKDNSFVVFLDVISLASGEKLMALRARCWHENAFRRLARAFTREIVNRVDITGTVVTVAGEKFFVEIERGAGGVKKGDLLAVRHPSKVVRSADTSIDQGEEPPFTELVVDAVTRTGHVRCVRKKGEEPKPAPAPGDLVRLVPVCPVEERVETVAALPFSFTAGGNAEAGDERKAFAVLVQQELLVGASKIRGRTLISPPGIGTYADGSADGRVVCDDLGVDSVLGGSFVVTGNELRAYPELVVHPQTEVYERDRREPAGSVRKRIVVSLKEDGTLTPEAACEVAAEIAKAYGEDEKGG